MAWYTGLYARAPEHKRQLDTWFHDAFPEAVRDCGIIELKPPADGGDCWHLVAWLPHRCAKHLIVDDEVLPQAELCVVPLVPPPAWLLEDARA